MWDRGGGIGTGPSPGGEESQSLGWSGAASGCGCQRFPGDSQNVATDNFSDVLVVVATLDESDGEEWPVGPGDTAGGGLCNGVIVCWPQRAELFALSRSGGKFLVFVGGVLGGVGDIGAERDVVDSDGLDHVVDMIQQRVDVTLSAKESGDAADADVASSGGDRLDDRIGFAADVRVEFPAGGVTGDDRFVRDLGGFEAGLPAGVGTIGDDSDAVHLANHGSSKVTETGVGFFGATVADHVSSLVGEVHHADAELKKDLEVSEFIGDRVPVLRQRDAVAGEVEAVAAF